MSLTHIKRITITFVFMLLCAPLLLSIGNSLKGQSNVILEMEKRTRQPFPPFPDKIRALRNYTLDIENWINDQFGGRTQMILVNRKLTGELGIDSQQAVLNGTDGWMFLTVNNRLDYFIGLLKPDSNRMLQWLEQATALQKKLLSQNSRLFIFIAPDKLSVLPEMLPTHINQTDSPTSAQLLQASAVSKGLRVLFPLEAMKEASQSQQTYFKTDTHWNFSGAYIGYLSFTNALHQAGIDIPTVSPTDLTMKESKQQGDLIAIAGRQETVPEMVKALHVTKPSKPKKEYHEDFRFNEFSAFTLTTPHTDLPSLLILGDSFSYGMIPFLQESFSRITFAHHHFGAFDHKIFDTYGADITLLFYVERNLLYELTH